MSSPVFTSEELRIVAMNTSARRGKSVARRRLIWRWFAWFMWRVLLPVIGLAAILIALAGFTFWQYKGHVAAYIAVQTWVQQEFGTFQQCVTKNSITASNGNLIPNRPENTTLIPLTYEATPDLRIDRHLTVKQNP